jgi:hypothetical protein
MGSGATMKFNEDWFSHSNVYGGDKQIQHTGRISLLLRFQIKESKLQIRPIYRRGQPVAMIRYCQRQTMHYFRKKSAGSSHVTMQGRFYKLKQINLR